MAKRTACGARGFVPRRAQLRSDVSPEDAPLALTLRCSELAGLRFYAEGTSSNLYEQIDSTRASPSVALASRKLLYGNVVTAPRRGGEQADVGPFAVTVRRLSQALVESVLEVDPRFQDCTHAPPPGHARTSDLDQRVGLNSAKLQHPAKRSSMGCRSQLPIRADPERHSPPLPSASIALARCARRFGVAASDCPELCPCA